MTGEGMTGRIVRLIARRETMSYIIVALGFIAVNLVTADRSPPVWVDEVYLLDPAVNLAEGRGFVGSLGLLERDRSGIWVGYAPLYPWLLSGWVRCFGVGVTQVRSLNYFMAVLAASLFIAAGRRSGILTVPWLRVGLFATWLCAYGVAFCYRCGRVDVLHMVLVGGLALLWAGRSRRWSAAMTALMAAASPWAGLQACAIIGMLATFGLALSRGARWREWISTALGGAIGAFCFWATYAGLGAWGDFWSNASGHLNQFFIGSNGFHDLSLRALGGGAAGTMFWAVVQRSWTAAWAAALGIAVGLAVALGVMVLGHFPIYYSWMAFLPLWFGWGVALDRLWSDGRRGFVAWVGVSAMCVTAGLGLPARLAFTVMEWRARDYGYVERLVREYVHPGDIVAVDYPGYYAVRLVAAGMMVGQEVGTARADTLARLDAVVGNAEYYQKLLPKLGPGWDEAGRVEPGATAQYQLRVFRKTRQTSGKLEQTLATGRGWSLPAALPVRKN